MNVIELIEALRLLPPELEVYVRDDAGEDPVGNLNVYVAQAEDVPANVSSWGIKAKPERVVIDLESEPD